MRITDLEIKCSTLSIDDVVILEKIDIKKEFNPHCFGESTFYYNLFLFLKKFKCSYKESGKWLFIYRYSEIVTNSFRKKKK